MYMMIGCRDKVMAVVVKSMKNPRSALIKSSIMASADIFNAFGDSLLDSTTSDAFDQLVCTHYCFPLSPSLNFDHHITVF